MNKERRLVALPQFSLLPQSLAVVVHCVRTPIMNETVNVLYAEFLTHTGGDKAAAAILTLAATLRDCHTAVAELAESKGL